MEIRNTATFPKYQIQILWRRKKKRVLTATLQRVLKKCFWALSWELTKISLWWNISISKLQLIFEMEILTEISHHPFGQTKVFLHFPSPFCTKTVFNSQSSIKKKHHKLLSYVNLSYLHYFGQFSQATPDSS